MINIGLGTIVLAFAILLTAMCIDDSSLSARGVKVFHFFVILALVMFWAGVVMVGLGAME